MSKEATKSMEELLSFMFNKVYIGSIAKAQSEKAQHILEKLYLYFCSNPEKLPKDFLLGCDKDNIERIVCDYIAGMTDRYAINLYNELFIPKPWYE